MSAYGGEGFRELIKRGMDHEKWVWFGVVEGACP